MNKSTIPLSTLILYPRSYSLISSQSYFEMQTITKENKITENSKLLFFFQVTKPHSEKCGKKLTKSTIS